MHEGVSAEGKVCISAIPVICWDLTERSATGFHNKACLSTRPSCSGDSRPMFRGTTAVRSQKAREEATMVKTTIRRDFLRPSSPGNPGLYDGFSARPRCWRTRAQTKICDNLEVSSHVNKQESFADVVVQFEDVYAHGVVEFIRLRRTDFGGLRLGGGHRTVSAEVVFNRLEVLVRCVGSLQDPFKNRLREMAPIAMHLSDGRLSSPWHSKPCFPSLLFMSWNTW